MSIDGHATGSPLERIAGGLVVSCQARPGHPLRQPAHMAAMALAAEAAGALGIRAAGMQDIEAIRAVTALPILGLTKVPRPDSPVIITATGPDAAEVVGAGADLVAIDGTGRPRPDGWTLVALIEWIHRELRAPVLADVDSLDAALSAVAAGADAVATTLSGYTGSSIPDEPDLELVSRIAGSVAVPVIAEGRFAHPWQVAEALQRGAHAVVVGTAITDPVWIAATFVDAMRVHRQGA